MIANAAGLDISLADQTIGSLAGAGGATVNLGTHILTTGGNNTSTTYAGLITGSGGLTKVGLGTLTLSGTSIYSGATNINAGVLAGGAPNSLSQFSAFPLPMQPSSISPRRIKRSAPWPVLPGQPLI